MPSRKFQIWRPKWLSWSLTKPFGRKSSRAFASTRRRWRCGITELNPQEMRYLAYNSGITHVSRYTPTFISVMDDHYLDDPLVEQAARVLVLRTMQSYARNTSRLFCNPSLTISSTKSPHPAIRLHRARSSSFSIPVYHSKENELIARSIT